MTPAKTNAQQVREKPYKNYHRCAACLILPKWVIHGNSMTPEIVAILDASWIPPLIDSQWWRLPRHQNLVREPTPKHIETLPLPWTSKSIKNNRPTILDDKQFLLKK